MCISHTPLSGGKYEVIHNNGSNLHALRYGKPWRDLTGDGLVLALVHRIEELECYIYELKNRGKI